MKATQLRNFGKYIFGVIALNTIVYGTVFGMDQWSDYEIWDDNGMSTPFDFDFENAPFGTNPTDDVPSAGDIGSDQTSVSNNEEVQTATPAQPQSRLSEKEAAFNANTDYDQRYINALYALQLHKKNKRKAKNKSPDSKSATAGRQLPKILRSCRFSAVMYEYFSANFKQINMNELPFVIKDSYEILATQMHSYAKGGTTDNLMVNFLYRDTYRRGSVSNETKEKLKPYEHYLWTVLNSRGVHGSFLPPITYLGILRAINMPLDRDVWKYRFACAEVFSLIAPYIIRNDGQSLATIVGLTDQH